MKTVRIIQKDVEKSISIVWSQRKWQPAKARCKLLLHGRVGPVLISSWNGLIGVSTPGIKASNTEIHTVHPVSAQCRETTGGEWGVNGAEQYSMMFGVTEINTRLLEESDD